MNRCSPPSAYSKISYSTESPVHSANAPITASSMSTWKRSSPTGSGRLAAADAALERSPALGAAPPTSGGGGGGSSGGSSSPPPSASSTASFTWSARSSTMSFTASTASSTASFTASAASS